MRFANGRLHLVLGWPEMTVVGVLLIVALVAAYETGAGRSKPAESPPPNGAPSPSKGTDADTAKVARSDIKPGHPAGGGAATPRPAGGDGSKVEKPPDKPLAPPKKEETAEASGLKNGSFYVVVQHFRLRDREAADAARAFLQAKSVECVIHTGQDLLLVVNQPFSAETQEAKNLANRIRELGKEYKRTGGGYDFKDAGPRKF